MVCVDVSSLEHPSNLIYDQTIALWPAAAVAVALPTTNPKLIPVGPVEPIPPPLSLLFPPGEMVFLRLDELDPPWEDFLLLPLLLLPLLLLWTYSLPELGIAPPALAPGSMITLPPAPAGRSLEPPVVGS
uniref:Uncharacterized protein n=1 Tax=Anopheles atroparvus TaxID=41427 RepID=A0A182IXT0_ANOAO